MAQPVIVQDATLRQFARSFAGGFSLPQWKYFVIVLLGLLHCDAAHTLSGMLRQVAITATVSGLSRFLKRAPWSVADLTVARTARFKAQVAAEVAQAHAAQRAARPRRRGRPCETVVTGFLIQDDSTHVKRYAEAMEGQGWHYSTTERKSMPGHSLFQSVYCLLGRELPLTPELYRQRSVCEQEGVPFLSKVDLAVRTIQTFEPPPDTQTHVLVDSWYVNKAVWRATRQRDWDLTGGLKSNRQIRQTRPDDQRVWLSVAAYAAGLAADDFQPVIWPNQEGGQQVYGHLLRTRVKKLGVCQVLMVKFTPDAPVSQCRYWVTSRLDATLDEVVAAVATRWAIEALFADLKELLGSDQYQIRSAQAIVRFWALALCLYQYLDEQRVRLRSERQQPVTLGEARTWVRQRHADLLLDWLAPQFAAGATADQVRLRLKPALA
jgi:hypothetical protein